MAETLLEEVNPNGNIQAVVESDDDVCYFYLFAAPDILAPGDDYISSDTGMSCKDLGGIGICGAPRGTVHYRNDKGENCTRTGLVSICD